MILHHWQKCFCSLFPTVAAIGKDLYCLDAMTRKSALQTRYAFRRITTSISSVTINKHVSNIILLFHKIMLETCLLIVTLPQALIN